MPRSVTPMKASLAAHPPKGEDWLFEVKWDGIRAICFIEGERVRLTSRSGSSCEKQYPELNVIPHYIAASEAIIDAEIVVLDEKGVSRFPLIQPRISNSDANSVAHMARSRPVTLFAFDLIYLDGYDLRKVALIERKRLLESILEPCPVMRYSDHFPGAGEAMLEAARETGLEGILAKHANSCYEPKRSREWLKLKIVSQQEFVICGYTEGERAYFSSLVLGAYDHGRLIWVGNAGTGFNQKSLEDIYQRLQTLAVSRAPFPEPPPIPRVRWVRPELVAMVKFANWTEDRKLRAPVFLGLRPDVDPRECTLEAEEAISDDEAIPGDAPGESPGRQVGLPTLIDGRRLKFTNLDKIYYPGEGYTKGDVLNHYNAVADLILPHLKDRPLSLKRYPNGIASDFFFQKDSPKSFASWLRIEPIYSEHNRAPIRFVLAEDRASLLYLTNLGCIDQNPWMSRVGSLENPDFILIDLDPQDCPFELIVEAALMVRRTLERIGLEGYPKTTGGDGLHIYIPIEPDYTYDESKTFAELIANVVIAEKPKLFTTPRAVSHRERGRVYFDYLQNGFGKTIAAPYVLRAYPGAPVATPLEWRDVTPSLTPNQFHIRNVLERFERIGDIFSPVLTNKQRLERPLEKLEKLMRATSKAQ